jgi:hypothetical protein
MKAERDEGLLSKDLPLVFILSLPSFESNCCNPTVTTLIVSGSRLHTPWSSG